MISHIALWVYKLWPKASICVKLIIAESAIAGFRVLKTWLEDSTSEFKKNPLKFVNVFKIVVIRDTSLNVKGKILKISYINKDEIAKANGMFLVYWEPTSKISTNLMLIIRITNKKSTVIAPTN